MNITYHSHSLGDSSSNSNCGASTRAIAGSTGRSRSFNESDSLGSGAVDDGGASVGGILSRLGSRDIGARLRLCQG